ncbi:MAG TPA: YeeE/YedE family protein, partial [Aquaticitalea sp.]|nr:YeeE/YedE family protein [Aquaticitalea sp.]
MDWILEPWPWYICGPLIALTMFLLLYLGKNFGMSSNLRTLCTVCGAGKTSDFFRFDWKSQRWNLWVVAGAIIGGYLASHYLSVNQAPDLNPKTIAQLNAYGITSAGNTYV